MVENGKTVEQKGFFSALTYLVFYDDRKRWTGLLIVCAFGAIFSTSNDPNFAMGIGLPLIAVIMFGCYYFFAFNPPMRKTGEAKFIVEYDFHSEFIGGGASRYLRSIPFMRGNRLATMAIVLGSLAVFSDALIQQYETQTLRREVTNAYEVKDYSRLAAVSRRAEQTNPRVYKTLVTDTESPFLAATEKPRAWTEMLQSLGTVTAPMPEMRLILQKDAQMLIGGGYKFTEGSFDISAVGKDAFVPVDNPHNRKELPALLNSAIRGGQQTLDGFEWTNVTFIGTRISYKGGVVKMNNVRFINCTFVLPSDSRGAKIAQYVALALPTLSLSTPA